MERRENDAGKSDNGHRERGVFEKVPGSGVWYIRFADETGRIRKEKAGTKADAIALRIKRKAEVLRGVKLPERVRGRKVLFGELADDAEKYVKANNLGWEVDRLRIAKLRAEFGNDPADVAIEELRDWFDDHEWEAGSYNRYRTVLSRIYALGMENKKVGSNPARLLKHRREPDGRVRFLGQHDTKEEARLRKVITAGWPEHLPELDIAVNTGMRRREQYRYVDWSCVNFRLRDLFVPKSKMGPSRHIPLNKAALAAFRKLHASTKGVNPIFASRNHGESLKGNRHWFEDAVAEAKVEDFTWRDLRHTFASRLVMRGVDLRSVADLMGHKNIQMTMRYAHLAPAHKQDAVARLDAFSEGRDSGIVKTKALRKARSKAGGNG